jgi:CheY-like chemotaxis protein
MSELKAENILPSLRFLLVEDNAYTQKLLAEVLKALGVPDGNVFQATDGASALEQLKLHPVDIVITDARMEPVDGIALTRAIRSADVKIHRDVPIILCTAYSEAHRITEARDAGVTEIVLKPFSVQAFYKRICAVIERPRSLIESTEFTGPDRRRIAEDVKNEKRQNDYKLR